MKKAIMFDLDNTIYSFDNAEIEALKKVHKLFNKYQKISYIKFNELFKIVRTEIKREMSGSASAHSRMLYFQRLVEKTHANINLKLILKLRELYWKEFLKNIKINKETKQTLEKLKKQGIKIAIVSNAPTQIQLEKLIKMKIDHLIDAIITSQEAGNEKPNATMFLLALNKLECTSKEVIMVGDNPILDVAAANVLNIDTILITEHKNNENHIIDTEKPNYVIKSFKELDEIINKK